MFEKDADYKPAGKFAWFAERDARMRSLVNSSLYSDKQKVRAERMKLALELCVVADQVYVEFRKKFISVKINRPRVTNRKNLELLESDWTKEGITKVNTSQGFTYRVFA